MADPDVFVRELGTALHGDRGSVLLGDEGEPVPGAYLAYVRGPARALLDGAPLLAYISSPEQTHTTDPGSLIARQAARRLKQLLRTGRDAGRLENPSEVLEEINALERGLSAAQSLPSGGGVLLQLKELERAARELASFDDEVGFRQAAERALAMIDRIADTLLELRREATLAVAA